MPRRAAGGLVEPEVRERLARVEIGLARTHDGQCSALAVDDRAIDAVGAGERRRRRQSPIDQAVLFDERRLILPQVQAAWRQLDAGRDGEGAVDVRKLDRSREIQGVGDALESRVAAAVSRHGPPEEAEFQDLADRRRIKDRQKCCDQAFVRTDARYRRICRHDHRPRPRESRRWRRRPPGCRA